MKNVTGKAVRKLYINQFVISIFGVIVSFAAAGADEYLILPAALLAAGLYLFVCYDMMWNEGAKAAAKTLRAEDAGIAKIKTPFLIILFGSAFNILCAVSYAILKIYVYANDLFESLAADMGNILNFIMKITQGMYLGFDTLLFRNPNTGMAAGDEWIEVAPMLTEPYFYLLTPAPLFIAGIFAYYLGASEVRLLKFLGFKSEKK